MSTADSQPGFDLELTPTAGEPAPGPAGQRAIWLDGDILSCACPECSAPMSIRVWLMVADCWRCGTSIELSEEQEREVRRLIEKQETSRRPEQPAPKPKPAPPAPPPAAKTPAPPPPRVSPPPPAVPKRQVASHANWLKARLRDVEERGELELFWRAVFKDLYAWLASLVVHLVLLIVLAILVVGGADDSKPPLEIVLSTHISDVRREGGRKGKPDEFPVEFDKPGKGKDNKVAAEDKPEQPDAGQKRGNDPKDLLRAAGTATAPAVNPEMIAGRSSTSRAELVQQEGGTSITEAAVTRGLHWLAEHQSDDGSWSLHRFNRVEACNGRCTHPGYNSDTSGTALALLPFLGAGQTHRQGQYKKTVEGGLQWLVDWQKSNGDLPSPAANTHMYAHGQGAITLCEAYALTRDLWLREPAQKAIDFIVKAQHKGGGWRYQPGDAGDTSVVGWELMALRSAQMADLRVPPECLERAMKYLDDAQTDKLGGRYGYMPGRPATHVMTAEALLCRQYAGWPQDHPGLIDGVEFLLDRHLPKTRKDLNMYYCYYAAQVMHHMGGSYWEQWNYRVRDLLVDTQETRGHEAGSWTPGVGHDDAGGRVYQTALAVCTLEVYYRHLPLYRHLAVEK